MVVRRERGAGAGARFKWPLKLALDERGRLLVGEIDRADTLRVVEASLAPPAWMGPADPAVAVGAGPLPAFSLPSSWGLRCSINRALAVNKNRLPRH